MMRSLWTAASGMISQQTNVDTIANNLANINTNAYKKETVEFKSLLYQNVQKNAYDSSGNAKPVGVQVGLGVRSASISSSFKQGALLATEGQFDFALEGQGFFMVQREDGSIGYTRNGSFKMSLSEDGGYVLSTSSANPVLDVNGNPIRLPIGTDVSKIVVDADGNLMVPDENNNAQLIGVQIGIARFNNPVGLYKSGDSLYTETDASGAPQVMSIKNAGAKLVSGYLEGSNVQAVEEMVSLIVAQRAYEMNSKAITASDQMLQQANNLRG